MGGSKSRGNLRDFRVDSLSGESLGASVKDGSKLPPRQSTVLKQNSAMTTSITSRSSVEEWGRDDSGLNESQLWKTWEEDLIVARELKTPNAATAVSEVIERNPQKIEEETLQRPNLPWAADLALTERRMERRGEVEYSNSFKKQEMLKQQTSEYIRVLKSEFSRHLDVFNEARQSGAHAVHLYSISGTEDDFMLFRNGVKLVVSAQRSGRILFAFNQYLGQVYAPNQSAQIELEAQWGPFERLFWSYRNERVQVQDVVRYFVSEFIKQSYK